MTPKQKAKDLLIKFMPQCGEYEFGKYVDGMLHKNAKKSALICVKQIIKSGATFPSKFENSYWIATESAGKYWQEVEQEIQKL